MGGADYGKAGAGIRGSEAPADYIKGMAPKAAPDLRGYRDPVILSTAAGVGEKLLVAKRLGRYDAIGIDLVAMSVNGLVVRGARPVQFLHYAAYGRIGEEILQSLASGVAAGCEAAGCEPAGGEAAEAPEMYAPGDIGLAGFAVGLAERGRMLPHLDRMEEGDAILGIPSSGVHSDGLGLAMKALGPGNEAAWEELLVPTRIYVRELLDLMSTGRVLGAAHIAGSGLAGGVDRALPPGLRSRISWDWPVPPIFGKIQAGGKVADEEMRSVFNMGVGLAIIAKKEEAEGLVDIARAKGLALLRVGELARG